MPIPLLASWSTATALGLAAVDAACFGGAALLQHRGVQRLSQPVGAGEHRQRLPLRAMRRLLHDSGWLLGSGLIVIGTLLHVIALALAPLGLIQPVGVLAVPFAVVLAARLRGRAPTAGMITGVTLSVLGTGGFVLLANRPASTPVVGLRPVLITTVVLAVTAAALWTVSARLGPVLRCAGFATVGAMSFGFGSTLARIVAGSAPADYGRLVEPASLLTVGVLTLAVAVGGWAVQQAYAAGSAEVVIATLTVVDPMIAVLLGMTLLGEEAGAGGLTRISMLICGLVAAGGVALAARYHPSASRGEQPVGRGAHRAVVR